MSTAIIVGSSRNAGKTRQIIDHLCTIAGYDVIDLSNFEFSYYDYEHKNKDDDFLSLAENIISRYDTLIFATPVYWYAMSGIMKVFFDRLTDLLDNEKELGRKLRGKNMAVITSSVGDNLGDKFWFPFVETSRYLGMHYIGNLHTIETEDSTQDLIRFVQLIDKNGKGI